MAKFRRKAKSDSEGSDTVDLGDSEHAWWATGRIQHAYGYATETPVPPEEPVVETPAFEPWTFNDVFAANVDGEIGRDADETSRAATTEDSRDLAQVFVEESAYRTLGLEPGATWDEIVLAHRRVAKCFHPDRLVGADEATQAAGEEQMRQANAAYEQLRKRHRAHTPATGLFGS